MSTKNDLKILFPVGRIIQGSLYSPSTTDAEGRPLVYKTGQSAGQPRSDYYFAVGIPKTAGHTHWAQTDWGKQIWDLASVSWPQGQAQRPDFAFKITDGDSIIPNKKGKKPADQVGHAGHWVVRFSSSFAPKIFNANGTAPIVEKDAVKPGYFVQVYGTVKSNESAQTAGMHINHDLIAFAGYGEEIVFGPDAAAVGFGAGVAPAGMSAAPLGGFVPPAILPAPAPSALPPPPAIASPPAPVVPALSPAPPPNMGFVAGAVAAPPPPVAPARVMLPAANGATYESLIAAGWNDALLVQHGMMTP